MDGNPGGYVWSTGNAGTTVPTTETYFGMGGTSMSAPHVAAVVALMLMDGVVRGQKKSRSRTGRGGCHA